MNRRRLGPDDLVLAHFSLPRSTPFRERVAAAAAAGFGGIGWYGAEYAALRAEGWTDADVARVLDEHDMVLHEIDAFPLDRLGHLDAAVHLATSFGAHHVQVQGDRPGSFEDAARVVGAIADRVAPAGVDVAIEFVGNKNIATAADALALAELTGRANVGVQIDIWHHVRGANDWSLLDAVPDERIVSVQLDDGPLEPVDPDYYADTVHHRLAPGEGQFDLVRFLRDVHARTRLPLSIEVIDDDLLGLPAADAAHHLADATRRVMRLV